MDESESWFIERMINLINRIESPIRTDTPSLFNILRGKEVPRPSVQNLTYMHPIWVFLMTELQLIIAPPLFGLFIFFVSIIPLGFIGMGLASIGINLENLGLIILGLIIPIYIIIWIICVISFPFLYFRIRSGYPSRIFSITLTQSQTVPLVPDKDSFSHVQEDFHTQLNITAPEKKASTLNITSQQQVSGEFQIQTKGQLIVNLFFFIIAFISVFGALFTQNLLLLILLPISIVFVFYYNWKLKKTDETPVVQVIREKITEFNLKYENREIIRPIIFCLLFVFAVPIFLFFAELFSIILTGEITERIVAVGLLMVIVFTVIFLIQKIKRTNGESE